MAPRSSRTVLADPLAEARKVASDLAARVRRHNQVCSECHTAGADTAKLCNDGWEMAKKIARANAAVRREESRPPPPLVQGAPW